MAHIMRIGEMLNMRRINEAKNACEDGEYYDGHEDTELNPNEKYTLREIFCPSGEDHTKFEMTVEGLIAVYETLPNHLDTTLLKECYDVAFGQGVNTLSVNAPWFMKAFICDDLLFNNVTDEQFIEIVESGKFLKNTDCNVFYTLQNGDHFDNSQYKQWAEEIRNFVDFSK